MNSTYDFTTGDLSTGSLTVVNVPVMLFPLDTGNEIVQFEFLLAIGSSNAAGLKVAIDVPAGTLFRAWAIGSGASRNALIVDPMTQSGVLGVAFNTFNGSQNFLNIKGAVKTGTGAGNLQLQVAKVTNGTATLHAGSYFTAQRL